MAGQLRSFDDNVHQIISGAKKVIIRFEQTVYSSKQKLMMILALNYIELLIYEKINAIALRESQKQKKEQGNWRRRLG